MAAGKLGVEAASERSQQAVHRIREGEHQKQAVEEGSLAAAVRTAWVVVATEGQTEEVLERIAGSSWSERLSTQGASTKGPERSHSRVVVLAAEVLSRGQALVV